LERIPLERDAVGMIMIAGIIIADPIPNPILNQIGVYATHLWNYSVNYHRGLT
jgi:hypothetical protein